MEETQIGKRKGIQTEGKVELLEEKTPWEPKRSSVFHKEGLSFNNQVSGQSETTTNELILERTNAGGTSTGGLPQPQIPIHASGSRHEGHGPSFLVN